MSLSSVFLIYGIGFVIGAICGYNLRRNRDQSTNIVNQSGNIAGGDIVGRNKHG